MSIARIGKSSFRWVRTSLVHSERDILSTGSFFLSALSPTSKWQFERRRRHCASLPELSDGFKIYLSDSWSARMVNRVSSK